MVDDFKSEYTVLVYLCKLAVKYLGVLGFTP